VRSQGEIKWKGRPIFISEVLAGEPVGLDEIDDGVWAVYFGPLELGRIKEDTGRLYHRARKRPAAWPPAPAALRPSTSPVEAEGKVLPMSPD
jgi:hypothetical protein